ncbi:MAG: DUF2470 domain-containing protein [Phycisphaerales bacterium]|nr:DUF2470 domain-containing protein [Phycisphaerales bacterium]
MTAGNDPTYTAADARDFLRRHTVATLDRDGFYSGVRYVLGPRGEPIICGSADILTADSTVLFIPSDVPDVLELLATVEAVESESHEADRWRIYHGKPTDIAFYRMNIDAAKWRGQVFDGEDLMEPNALAPVEPALCRWMNTQHRADLMAMSRHFNGVEIDEAVLVGVDPSGIDIRAKAGIIRIDSRHRLADEAQARAVIEEMRREALAPRRSTERGESRQ